jgi:hypothetical protein
VQSREEQVTDMQPIPALLGLVGWMWELLLVLGTFLAGTGKQNIARQAVLQSIAMWIHSLWRSRK